MAATRLFFVALVVVLFASVSYAERARNDHLGDEDEELMNFENDNYNNDDSDEVIETIKRFLSKKKTTTAKPSTDAIAALLTTTPSSKTSSTSTKGSIFGGMFTRKTTSTARSTLASSTSRFDRVTTSTGSFKDACGTVSPCKNGGTCKTLSSGRFYCFCSSDYYGKNCENKFITSGTANADRTRVDHCAKSPCMNGGECVGLRTTYYCRCKLPFYGTNCDKRISKREESLDDWNESEQTLEEYRRDLEQDTEDLRQAIADENVFENIQ